MLDAPRQRQRVEPWTSVRLTGATLPAAAPRSCPGPRPSPPQLPSTNKVKELLHADLNWNFSSGHEMGRAFLCEFSKRAPEKPLAPRG